MTRNAPNVLVPCKGMTVNVYLSRRDVGSGIRPYLILGVGSRYITFYSIPRLYQFKLRRGEWLGLKMIEEYEPNIPFLLGAIAKQVERYSTLGLRYSVANANKAIEVLKERQI